jgi:hypothetical protein
MDGAAIAIISGSVTVVATSVVALVRIAVSEARARADDWREIARTERETGTVRDGHVERLVGAVEALTAAQRESLETIKAVAAAVLHRDAA